MSQKSNPIDLDDRTKLQIFFERGGYVRWQNDERRESEGFKRYKKGHECRFVADSPTEIEEIQRLLTATGFTFGKAFAKANQIVLPMYGTKQVLDFLTFIRALDKASTDSTTGVCERCGKRRVLDQERALCRSCLDIVQQLERMSNLTEDQLPNILRYRRDAVVRARVRKERNLEREKFIKAEREKWTALKKAAAQERGKKLADARAQVKARKEANAKKRARQMEAVQARKAERKAEKRRLGEVFADRIRSGETLSGIARSMNVKIGFVQYRLSECGYVYRDLRTFGKSKQSPKK